MLGAGGLEEHVVGAVVDAVLEGFLQREGDVRQLELRGGLGEDGDEAPLGRVQDEELLLGRLHRVLARLAVEGANLEGGLHRPLRVGSDVEHDVAAVHPLDTDGLLQAYLI